MMGSAHPRSLLVLGDALSLTSPLVGIPLTSDYGESIHLSPWPHPGIGATH